MLEEAYPERLSDCLQESAGAGEGGGVMGGAAA